MQIMSVFQSNLEFLETPKFQYEPSASYVPTRRRRRRELGFGACFPNKGLGLSSSFGNSVIHKCVRCDIKGGFSSSESGFGFHVEFEKHQHSLFKPSALASLEHEPSVSKQTDDDSEDGRSHVYLKSESWKLDSLVGKGVEHGYEPNRKNSVPFDGKRGNTGENKRKIDVRALAQRLKFAKNVDDVEKVLKGMELPLPVYCSMIRGFGMDGRLQPAFALIDWLKQRKNSKENNGVDELNVYIYNSLLGAAKASQHYDEIRKILEDMEEQGIPPNVVTYNTLMAICLDQGKPEEALMNFEEIAAKGLSPTSVSYSTVLLVYREMGNASGAIRFFGGMQEQYQNGELGKGSDEDWGTEFHKMKSFAIKICYTVMRRWLVSGENVSIDVLKLLNDMDGIGLQFSRADYERLAWACTSEDHFSVAREVYKRIRERETDISLSVCNHVIWVMGKAKKWWAALEIYEEMLDNGPKPNNLSYELIVSHFNVLLTAAKKRGIWKWAVRLIDKMQDRGLKPSSREWNSVLIACARASEASTAIQIFMRMVEQGEKPTVHSYGALLSALEKGEMYNKAITVWQHMHKVDVLPNLYTYTTMALVYIGNGNYKNVDALIQEMTSRGIEPSVVTFNAIISGCARNGLGSVAFEWFHRMKAKSIQPNEVTYDMLIEALAKDGKPRLAYEIYVSARNEGTALSSRAYDAIITSSKIYNAGIEVSLLGPRPPGRRSIEQTKSEPFSIEDAARGG